MSNIEKFLSDYTLPTHSIISCDLKFIISDDYTIVENIIQLQGKNSFLVLDGIDLELVEISLDGRLLLPTEYKVDRTSLELNTLPEVFTLRIITKIFPESNTALEGLFKSGSIYCTQNEPE